MCLILHEHAQSLLGPIHSYCSALATPVLGRVPHTSPPSLHLSHILTCMTLPQTFPSFLLVLLCKPCVSQAGCSLLPTSLRIFLLDLLHNFSISFAHNRENQLSHLKSALWQVCHGLPRQSASQWSQGCASTVTLRGQPGRPMGVAACTLLPCS